MSERGADYGDAPDGITAGYREGDQRSKVVGQFPTRSKNAGARVLVPSKLWLGTAGSLEADADDEQDPDGRSNLASDADDGLISLLLDRTGSAPMASLTLSIGQRELEHEVYLNVLVDLNRDGRWSGKGKGGEPEWAIQNFALNMNGAGKRQVQREFTYANGGVVPHESWMRVLVSDQKVPPDWDGTGTFEHGEVEDHLIEMSSQSSLLDVDCSNPASGSGSWSFDGQRTAFVRCKVSRAENGPDHDVSFELVRDSGGVRHTTLCSNAPVEEQRPSPKVHVGPISVGSAPKEITCLYESDTPLPSKWSLELRLPPTPSSPTERGVHLGHGGRVSVPFAFEKGTCPKKCTSDRQCFGDTRCTDHCCVPAWAPECSTLEAEACGRCCALSGGVNAPDCVRQACAL